VGFIRKLPHDLVESFKSTLDEVREADIILHIVDISHSSFEDQILVVNQTLHEINVVNKPVIIIFNKIDAYTYIKKEDDDLSPKKTENFTLEELKKTWIARHNDPCIFISAKETTNIEELKRLLYKKVREIHITRYPYDDFLY
jgi:GTP-binding protein HflX